MKKAAFLLFLCCLSTAMIGCMSSNVNTTGANITTIPTPTTAIVSGPSHIAHRVFVSNSTTGNLQIVDADKDVRSTFGIAIGGSPTFIAQTPDLKIEVVYDSANHTLSQIDNSKETVNSAAALPGASESVTVNSTGTVAFAAVQTAQNPVNGVAGEVWEVVFTASTSTTPATATPVLLAAVPGVRWIATNHAANNLLSFSDGATSVANSVTAQAGSIQFAPIPGFDHPVAGYFTNDDSTAFVLSSGPAHGGTQAMVTRLNMTPSTAATPTTPLVVSSVNVAAATVGFLSADGLTLYVAGPQPCSAQPCGVPTGVVSVINTSTMTVTSSASLSSGTPKVMASDGTNVWIGSTGCEVSAASPQGCLSLFFPGSGQVAVNEPSLTRLQDGNDDVTSLLSLVPLNGRDVMYVVEGGDLFEYSFSQSAPTINAIPQSLSAPQNLHIPGQALDAKAAQ